MAGESLGREFLMLAVQTEKNGQAFYQESARRSRKKDVKDVFKVLALREQEHENTFSDMLNHLGNHRVPEGYSRDDFQYLKFLADSLIFDNSRARATQTPNAVRTDIEALETGIGLEKDCILFYSDIRGMLPRSDQDAIDMIIQEEKQHLSELTYWVNRLRGGEKMAAKA
jgi:rubrerythrin